MNQRHIFINLRYEVKLKWNWNWVWFFSQRWWCAVSSAFRQSCRTGFSTSYSGCLSAWQHTVGRIRWSHVKGNISIFV